VQDVALAPRAVRARGQAQRGVRQYAALARHAVPAPDGERPRREALARVPRARRVLRAGRALRVQARRAVLALLLLPYVVAPLRSSPLPRR